MSLDYRGFESWLTRLGRQDKTIERHFTNLRVIERLLPNWTAKNIDCFLLDLKKAGKSSATLNSYVDSFRLYATYAGLSKEIQNTRHFPKERTNKTTLSCEEVEKLYTLPCPQNADPIVWAKDSLFIKVCALSGARPGEIAKLTRWNFENGYIKIDQTKTHRPRLIPIPAPLVEDFNQYIANLRGDRLFVTRTGATYSDKGWFHMFEKRLKMADIEKPGVTLYTLRHSMATTLRRKLIPAETVAKLLGNSVEMVENTYSHMVLDDVEAALNQHPLIRKDTSPTEILKQMNKLIKDFHLDSDQRFHFTIVETDGGFEFKAIVREHSS